MIHKGRLRDRFATRSFMTLLRNRRGLYRDPRNLSLSRGKRLNVESTTGKKACDAGQQTWLVLHQEGE